MRIEHWAPKKCCNAVGLLKKEERLKKKKKQGRKKTLQNPNAGIFIRGQKTTLGTHFLMPPFRAWKVMMTPWREITRQNPDPNDELSVSEKGTDKP